MFVYLVKRQYSLTPDGPVEDNVIAVCSSLDTAMRHINMPNWDTIVTRYTVDGGPDSEILVQNIDRRV